MALTREDLQAIADLMDEKLKPMKEDISVLKTDVTELKTDVAVLKTDVAEFNTEVTDRFKIMEGQLEMQKNQIARNTADIKLYK